LEHQAVEIVAQAMTSAMPGVNELEKTNSMKVAGYESSAEAARQVYAKSGVKPEEVDVVELHDCFSANELVTYEALQLCPVGGAGEFIDNGDNTYGGKVRSTRFFSSSFRIFLEDLENKVYSVGCG